MIKTLCFSNKCNATFLLEPTINSYYFPYHHQVSVFMSHSDCQLLTTTIKECCVTPCSLLNVSEESIVPSSGKKQGGIHGGESLQRGSPHPPKTSKLKKNTDFIDMMILKVLRDSPFSRNGLLNSAGD
jgi:hypothetical protein